MKDRIGTEEESVSLHGEMDAATIRDMWHPKIRKIYEYWESKRPGSGEMPRRRDVDPIELSDLLRWLWMVDIQETPLRFKYRLMGTKHVEAIGFDPTGMWIDEAFPAFVSGPGFADYKFMAEHAQPSYRKGPAHYHVADYKNLERIMLPLTREGQKCEIILALTVYS